MKKFSKSFKNKRRTYKKYGKRRGGKKLGSYYPSRGGIRL